MIRALLFSAAAALSLSCGMGGTGLAGSPGGCTANCSLTGTTTVDVLTATGLTTVDGLVPEADLADTLGTSDLTWLAAYIKTIYDQAGTNRTIYDSIDATRHIGAAVNGAASYGHKFMNSTALTPGTDRYIAGFYADPNGSVVATVDSSGGATFGGQVNATVLNASAGQLYLSSGNNDIFANTSNGNLTLHAGSGSPTLVANFNDATTNVKASVTIAGFYTQPLQTVTVNNDGNGGTAPASTITVTSNQINLAYADPQNASVGTISETGAVAGMVIYVTHTGAGGTVTFTEVAGQQEIGASACTLGLSDTFSAIYTNSSWHFLTCRDN